MWPYFVLFFVMAVPAFRSSSESPEDSRRNSLIFPTLFMTLAIGLRLQVGGDWYSYLRIFRFESQVGFWEAVSSKHSDPAYGLMNWLAGRLHVGIWFVNLACAAIFMWGLRSLCIRQTNPALAMLIAVPYMCVVIAMGYTRQSVALGLVMASIAQFQHRRIGRFAVLMILAPAFHKSAVIMYSVFAFATSKNKLMTTIAIGLLALGTYYVLLDSHVDALVNSYIKTGYSSGGAGIRIAMNALAACVLFFLWKKLPFEKGERRLWMVMGIGVIVTAAFFVISPSSTAVDRVALYLFPLQIAILSRVPDIANRSGGRSVALVNTVIIYSLAILVIWLFFGNATWTWIPYRNYLFVPSDFVPTIHRY